MSHIQDIGWDDWKNEGIVSGTANGQKRMEAVKIRFTEELAQKYDIYYRVHAQNLDGWDGQRMEILLEQKDMVTVQKRFKLRL